MDDAYEESLDDVGADSPYLAVNEERVRNHLYRALEREDVDIGPDDVPRLRDALETLSEAELQRFGRVAAKLEREDRDGLPFLALTDAEREYFDILETALERLNQDATEEKTDGT